MIGFQLVPDYFPALGSGLQVQKLSGVPLLSVCQLPLDRTMNRATKRTIDIVGSIIGLGLSALVVPWFCILVYLESPGSVLYRQRRLSRSGRSFHIYKIRSMRMNAETNSGAVWCKQEDPRRLRIGSFMRKWNIDELPQFWNVLIGEMSLVGPRPERPELIERFKHEIPNYNARHEIRGGLTGWAQIHGLRGDTDLKKRIEADLYYLENWNLFLDLYCIIATFFKPKNAY
jgi:lipopolysaccharide/colanic/teichoic acid biosynthesis glycosyltransferase